MCYRASVTNVFVVSGVYSRNRGVPKTHTDIEFVCLDGTVDAHKALLTEFCTTIWLLVDGQDTQVRFRFQLVHAQIWLEKCAFYS